MTCLFDSISCPDTFIFALAEKLPDPKIIWEAHPDKLGCSTSCFEGPTDPSFSHVSITLTCWPPNPVISFNILGSAPVSL